jgi:hypothetical protein
MKTKDTQTQKKLIRKHLLRGKSITPLDAMLKFGCFRLGARIHELRSEMPIQSELVALPNKKRVARYRMAA